MKKIRINNSLSKKIKEKLRAILPALVSELEVGGDFQIQSNYPFIKDENFRIQGSMLSLILKNSKERHHLYMKSQTLPMGAFELYEYVNETTQQSWGLFNAITHKYSL